MATTAVTNHDWAPVRSVQYDANTTMGTDVAPGTVIVSSAAIEIKLASGDDVQYPIGTQFWIVNDDDHITTFSANDDATNTVDGDLAGTAFAGSTHVVTLVAANDWVTGQITGA